MEYPSNSNKQKDGEPSKEVKPPEKKLEQVTSGKVIQRKKSIGKRLKEIFVGGEGRTVWSYIFMDVMIPAVKDMVVDAGTQGIERIFYGDERPRGRTSGRRGYPTTGYIGYNRMQPSRNPNERAWGQPGDRRDISPRGRATHNFDEIILETRGEAEEVLDGMFELISRYERASVSDLYALTGITASYIDNQWGWTDLRGANVQRLRQGYLLNLPVPELLKD